MDPKFAAVIFVEETRKLHVKSSNEIKVSCSILRKERFKDSVDYFIIGKLNAFHLRIKSSLP